MLTTLPKTKDGDPAAQLDLAMNYRSGSIRRSGPRKGLLRGGRTNEGPLANIDQKNCPYPEYAYEGYCRHHYVIDFLPRTPRASEQPEDKPDHVQDQAGTRV